MSYNALSLNSKLFQLTFLTCALALAGCGGGDGTDIIAPAPDLGNGSGSQPQTPVSATNISSINLTNSTGEPLRILTRAGATANVVVTDASGLPIEGSLVLFETNANEDADKVKLGDGKGNDAVLTDANGVAVINIMASPTSGSGSYSITATANYNGISASTNPYFFSLQSTNLIFDNVKISPTTGIIPFDGTAKITGLVKDSGTMQDLRGIRVSFVTNCGSFSVDNATTNFFGFSATYKAGNCVGKQKIVAIIDDSGAEQELTVNVLPELKPVQTPDSSN